MTLVLDATVGTASANSLVTVAEADTYFESRLQATAWTTLTVTARVVGFPVG